MRIVSIPRPAPAGSKADHGCTTGNTVGVWVDGRLSAQGQVVTPHSGGDDGAPEKRAERGRRAAEEVGQ